MFFPFIKQESNNDCSLACLAMLYHYYFKQRLDLNQLKAECHLSPKFGISLLELAKLANKYQIKLTSYRATVLQFKELQIQQPIIAQIVNKNFNFHFVIIYKRSKNKLLIADPENNEITFIKIEQFIKLFTGIIISTEKINSTALKLKSFKFNPFSIPKYAFYLLNLFISNLFLVIIFFLAQVVYKNLINEIILSDNLQITFILLLSFLIINLFHALLNFVLGWINQKFAIYFSDKIITKVNEKWFNFIPYINKNFNSSYYLQIYQDVNNVTTVFTNNTIEIATNFTTFLLTSYFLINTSFTIWIVIVITGITNLAFHFLFLIMQKNHIFNNTNKKLSFQSQVINVNNKFADYYHRDLLFTLKNSLNVKYQDFLLNNNQLNRIKNNNSFISDFFKHLLNFISIYLMLNLIYKNQISFSQLIFINSVNVYVLSFLNNLGQFCYFFPEFQKSYQRLNFFLNIKEKTKMLKILPLPAFNNKIIFNNVFLHYSNIKIFDNFSLNISGHNILLGSNGIGKTTFLSILSLNQIFYSGSIFVNKTDLKEYSNEQWQKECIYLTANSFLINGTILENLFSKEITAKKYLILEKLKLENLLKINGLNLNTLCDVENNYLSQGQTQMIVFMTLFFKPWKILLLDEALSNVTEKLKVTLINLLLNYFKNSIIIFATHDEQLKKYFNNVINLNKREKLT